MCSPERLRLPEVADARDETLVEDRLADGTCRIARTQAAEHPIEVRRLREDVRAEAAPDPAIELEDRAVEHRADVLVSAKHEPRAAEDLRVAPEDAPSSFHAEVAAKDETAFEVEQEVLADGLDALESPTVEPRRELLHGGARMRRLDLDLLAHEHLQPPCRRVKGVAFGHAAERMSPRARAVAAGAVAALVWGLQEPLDRRVFGCDYSDIALLGRGNRALGFVVHAVNGAAFGLVFDVVRERVDIDKQRLALALALAESTLSWPFLGLVDRDLVRSPRAFAQATYRHALFGAVLGRFA
jgi:hypothetical protein